MDLVVGSISAAFNDDDDDGDGVEGDDGDEDDGDNDDEDDDDDDDDGDDDDDDDAASCLNEALLAISSGLTRLIATNLPLPGSEAISG